MDREKILRLINDIVGRLKSEDFTLMEMKCIAENLGYMYESSTMHSGDSLLKEIGIKGGIQDSESDISEAMAF